MQAGVKCLRMLPICKMTGLIKDVELCLTFARGDQIIKRSAHLNRCRRVVVTPDQLGWPIHAVITHPGKHVDFIFGEGRQELGMAQAIAA